MSEERNLNLETVRAAAQALGQDGKEISHGLIYDYLANKAGHTYILPLMK